MKWRRLRKWAKWTCAVVAMLALSEAVVCRFFGWGYSTTSNSDDTLWSIGFYSGQVTAQRLDGLRQAQLKPPVGWNGRWAPHWYWGYAGEAGPYGAVFAWHAGILYKPRPSGWVVGASMLYPVTLTSIPAALLWYAERRRRGPGSCGSCGYDRRGLAATAKCPECGTVPS